MSNTTLPQSVYVTYIEAPKTDALLLAEDWLERSKTHRGWVWIEKYSNGFLIEAHEGGEGKSFLSGLVKSGLSYGIIPASSGDLTVELSASGVLSLFIEHDEKYMEDTDYLVATAPMKRITIDPSPYLLSAALISLLISVAMVMIAISARPPLTPISIPQFTNTESPISWWSESAHWGRNEMPVSVQFNKTDLWTINKEPKNVD